RYENASELGEQLGRWLDGLPIAVGRYSSWRLLALWRRRNRIAARWLAAFVLAAGAGLAVLFFWQQSDLFWQPDRGQARQRAVNDLWNAAEEEQRGARYGEAAVTLAKALPLLQGRQDLAEDLKRLQARQDLFRRLDEFTRNSDQAWFFAGEERGD